MQQDFNYISGLICEFLSDIHIINRFKVIQEKRISGWEIWLHIELAHFLSLHESRPEYHREIALAFDRRKEKKRAQLRPDFLIRKKGWRTESYAALEIKQHPNPNTCISSMYKDIQKLSKMKESAIQMRSFWCLGLFEARPEYNLIELAMTNLSDLNTSQIAAAPIRDTGISYLLF